MWLAFWIMVYHPFKIHTTFVSVIMFLNSLLGWNSSYFPRFNFCYWCDNCRPRFKFTFVPGAVSITILVSEYLILFEFVYFNVLHLSSCRYTCVLSMFHYSEFLAIAVTNPNTLSVRSFVLDNGWEYKVAAISCWLEFAIEWYLFPGML